MEPVDAIVVLSFKLDVEKIADVLQAIDPPHLPHFAGQARVAVGTDAAAVIDWLEGRTDLLPAAPKCPKCLGDKRIANSEDGEPWSAWESLPPGSDLAVTMGVVRPITCPECKGTGTKP